MESNVINQPGNSRPAGRGAVKSHRSRLPSLGVGRNGAGSMGAPMRSGGHSPPPRGVPAAARMRGSQSDTQIGHRPPADNPRQGSDISEISDALRTQYAAIVQIAEAVHAKAPAPSPTRAEVVARAEAASAAEVVRAENAQLRGVVEQQQGEISRLRATLMQLQGFAAAAAAPSPASKAAQQLTDSPARQAPQPRTPGSAEVNWDPSPSNHPPRHGSGLGGEAWVAVLGPCVRQKDQFCMRLAQRLGGQVVRAGPPKPGQDGAAGSQKQLEKLLDALCRGRGPHVLTDFPRTPSQLRDVSAQLGPPLVLLSVDVAGVDDRLGMQLVKQERAGGRLLRLGVLIDLDDAAAEAECKLIELSKGATVSSLSRTDVGGRVSGNRAMQAAQGERQGAGVTEWMEGQLGTAPAEVAPTMVLEQAVDLSGDPREALERAGRAGREAEERRKAEQVERAARQAALREVEAAAAAEAHARTENGEQTAAATKLQATKRGQAGRAEAETRRQQHQASAAAAEEAVAEGEAAAEAAAGVDAECAELDKAAVRLQARQRGNLARKGSVEPAAEGAAAQKVQAAEFSTMVSHQVPCFVVEGVAETEEEAAEGDAELDKAAVRLQARQRGRLARKGPAGPAAMEGTAADLEAAAALIQGAAASAGPNTVDLEAAAALIQGAAASAGPNTADLEAAAALIQGAAASAGPSSADLEAAAALLQGAATSADPAGPEGDA